MIWQEKPFDRDVFSLLKKTMFFLHLQQNYYLADRFRQLTKQKAS